MKLLLSYLKICIFFLNKRLTSHGSSLQISLLGGFSLASHKPSATTSRVDCNLHITDLVWVPPPQVAEHFVQGPYEKRKK